ncbi:MAG TPA: hypothetical protein VH370_06080 [Humisphaera sp.]|nr:hypothetical protein [Humisphaera sp.]
MLYLCSGTQSGGSTIVSWCFLQRRDMDGVLDARPDLLPAIPAKLTSPFPWIKFTISSFRFSEVRAHFESDGWTIRPLLVARDVRAVFNSLINKEYGRNGTSSDDPPLRLRLTRFLEDWRLFRQRDWPILRFESFALDPVKTLREMCMKMELSWDDSMVDWTKPPDRIADANFGSQTFLLSRGSSLTKSLAPSLADVRVENIPADDLAWLEQEFAEYNAAMGYAPHIDSRGKPSNPGRAVPRYENTRLYERIQRNQSRTQQAFTTAAEHHRAGRLQQAQSLCRQIITNQPDHREALLLLATIAHQCGNSAPLALLQRNSISPAEQANTLGLVLAQLDFADLAANAFRQAISLRTDVKEYRENLDRVLRQISTAQTRPMPLEKKIIALTPPPSAA